MPQDTKCTSLLVSADSLNQGEVVKESKPATFGFSTDKLVAAGLSKEISIDVYICEDPGNTGAPNYKTNGEDR